MYHQTTKREGRERIHSRIRNRISGTPERPRLSIFRSLKHIYAQVIDDTSGKTLVSAATLAKGAKKDANTLYGGNTAAAKMVGKQIAERAIEAGIKDVVFDRGGHRYHGRVKALADAAREAGLRF